MFQLFDVFYEQIPLVLHSPTKKAELAWLRPPPPPCPKAGASGAPWYLALLKVTFYFRPFLRVLKDLFRDYVVFYVVLGS